MISFITVCKGRLEHLKQTLPRQLAQPGSESIVVDFDCPDGTADWVRAECPAATVVAVRGEEGLHLGRARNLGARAARGDWLFFLDADILIDPNLVTRLRPRLSPDAYFRPQPVTLQTWGSVACTRSDFAVIGGYDEVIRGYGGEDDDLLLRLGRLGRRPLGFPCQWVSEIPHDDAARTLFYPVKDRWLSQRINSFYVAAKFELERALGEAAAFEIRTRLYEEVSRVVPDAGAFSRLARIEITLPDSTGVPVQKGWHLKRTLALTLTQVDSSPADTTAPPAGLLKTTD